MPEPSLSPLSVFFLLGCVQAVFLSMSLFTSKGNRRANFYLAALLIVFALDLFSQFLDASMYAAQVQWLTILIFPTDMLYGPLLWFYVRCMTGQPVTVNGVRPPWQLLPFALHALVIWSILPVALNPDLINRYPETVNSYLVTASILEPIFSILAIVHSATYIVLSFISVRRYQTRIGNTFSYREGVGLKWLTTLILLLSFLLVLFAFGIIVAPYFDLVDQTYITLFVSIVLVIYALGYFGIRQPAIFARLESYKSKIEIEDQPVESVDTENLLEEFSPSVEKYAKSALSDDLADELLSELKNFMEEEKPYLDNELNLPQLASQLEASPNHLSQAINEKLSMNFFDFVNSYRVEAAKQQLLSGDPKRYTILGLALDSGFNSKSAFYAGFKKYTGMTPTQFRQVGQPAS